MDLNIQVKHVALLILVTVVVYIIVEYGLHVQILAALQSFHKKANDDHIAGKSHDISKYTFVSQMCEERDFYLNWKAMLAPCFNRMNFGHNMLPRYLATHARLSRVISKTIRPTGEYSSITIKTFTSLGVPKIVGGDEWRVFVRGPSVIESTVRDMGDGHYKASFLLLEAGHYEVLIHLQDTLCHSYMDPPPDWFMKGNDTGRIFYV